jgi:hypothetical protein
VSESEQLTLALFHQDYLSLSQFKLPGEVDLDKKLKIGNNYIPLNARMEL